MPTKLAHYPGVPEVDTSWPVVYSGSRQDSGPEPSGMKGVNRRAFGRFFSENYVELQIEEEPRHLVLHLSRAETDLLG
jgi:hypothetical protein